IAHLDGFNVNDEIKLSYFQPDYFVKDVRADFRLSPRIDTNYSWMQGSLINVAVHDADVEYAKKLINTGNLIYIENSISFNVE
ncbi:MAG: hypothetical protein VW298_01950, partial [Candidatus Woesearchaeota archaeon]